MSIFGQKTVILSIKYALVGATSTLIDIGILTLLVEYGHIPLIGAAVISFSVAVVNSFLWNKRWTFKNKNPRIKRQYIKFFLTSLVGLGINLLFLSVFVYLFRLWYVIAKIIITVIVFFWNFTVNRVWTFRSYTIPRPQIQEVPTCQCSVIIPAYNEERDITNAVSVVVRYLQSRFTHFEIFVIDDGSTDKTETLLHALQNNEPFLHIIKHARNEGKGASVRDGMLAAHGAIILFMDADGATPIDELDQFLPFLKSGSDIVIGSRYLKESAIIRKQPWYRIAIGRIGNLFIQALLLDTIKDTQCGFKAFTFQSAKILFSTQTIGAWGFDMEILALAQHMGFSIKEVPVRWHDSETRESRFRPIKDAHRTFRELLRIKWNLIRGAYTLTKEKKSLE